MYKKVELPKEGYVCMEKEVAELWKEKDIVKKNFNQNEGKKYFMFYDGPPTANGMPHVGHIETRVMKDIIPRYKVMKGYYVPRKAGWDTHGLPVELEIEKALAGGAGCAADWTPCGRPAARSNLLKRSARWTSTGW